MDSSPNGKVRYSVDSNPNNRARCGGRDALHPREKRSVQDWAATGSARTVSSEQPPFLGFPCMFVSF